MSILLSLFIFELTCLHNDSINFWKIPRLILLPIRKKLGEHEKIENENFYVFHEVNKYNNIYRICIYS